MDTNDTTRRSRFSSWAPALAAALMLGAGTATADHVVDAGQPVVISDDIYKKTTAVVSATTLLDDSQPKSNNGHGNNADGVDSSNPGQGKGGPNGAPDASCDGSGACVDDESKGGGKGKSKK